MAALGLGILLGALARRRSDAASTARPGAVRAHPSSGDLPVRSEERVSAAIEAAGIGTIVAEFGGASGPRIQWSSKAKALYGWLPSAKVDEAILREALHPDDRDAVEAALRAALRPDGGGDCRLEHRVVWPDRSVHWISAFGQTSFALSGGRRVPRRSVGVLQDVTARREAEERLFAINQRLQSLMDAAPVGITFSMDASCRDVRGNAAAFDQFGAQPADNLSASAPSEAALGRRIRYFVDGRELADAALPLQRAVAENRLVGPIELEVHMPDGRRWYAEASGAPIRNAEGAVIGGLAVTVDVTKRRLAEQALRDNDRRKDEFLAVLSHELHNPLAPIRSAAHMLKRGDIDGALRDRCADVIERQVSVMTRLLEDLLDVSRIRHGRFLLRRQVVPIRRAVQLALESSRPAIDAEGHTLDLEMPEDDLWLDADTVRLAQVFGNLLNNAAKYTPRGGRIALRVRPDGAHVAVSVEDDGIGIAPEWRTRLFDMFTRAPGKATESKTGLGIGLSLSRTVVEMHGGEIQVRSDGLGKGSVFEVRLPRSGAPAVEASTDVRTEAGAAQATAPFERLVIVVADDNREAADSLAAALSLSGHDAHPVYTGRDAIAAAERLRPDVMLLDIGMPDLDGDAVCRALRARPEYARIRMIAVTGWGREEDRARTRSAGFDLHLMKPVHPDDILERLRARPFSPSSPA